MASPPDGKQRQGASVIKAKVEERDFQDRIGDSEPADDRQSAH